MTGGRNAVSLDFDSSHQAFLVGRLEVLIDCIKEDLESGFTMPSRLRAKREAAIYGRLRDGLCSGSIIPDPELTGAVERLLRASDEAADYRQTVLQHDAYAALVEALK